MKVKLDANRGRERLIRLLLGLTPLMTPPRSVTRLTAQVKVRTISTKVWNLIVAVITFVGQEKRLKIIDSQVNSNARRFDVLRHCRIDVLLRQ